MKTKSRFSIVLAAVTLMAVAWISCSTSPSVQRYIVDHENEAGFASFTVPADILQIQDGVDVDEESVEALNKLNNLVVLRYDISDGTPEQFESYLAELHTCLNPDRYEDVFMMNTGEMRVSLKIQKGNQERLSEIIALLEQGDSFLLARLTGEIEPDKLARLIRKIDYQAMMENEQLQGLIPS